MAAVAWRRWARFCAERRAHARGDLARHGELLEAFERIPSVEDEFLALPELNRASIHEVDAGNDHGRTANPCSDT